MDIVHEFQTFLLQWNYEKYDSMEKGILKNIIYKRRNKQLKKCSEF